MSLPSWPFVMRAWVSGVRVIDGLMVFTRMPNGPGSTAAARASATPPSRAQYTMRGESILELMKKRASPLYQHSR